MASSTPSVSSSSSLNIRAPLLLQEFLSSSEEARLIQALSEAAVEDLALALIQEAPKEDLVSIMRTFLKTCLSQEILVQNLTLDEALAQAHEAEKIHYPKLLEALPAKVSKIILDQVTAGTEEAFYEKLQTAIISNEDEHISEENLRFFILSANELSHIFKPHMLSCLFLDILKYKRAELLFSCTLLFNKMLPEGEDVSVNDLLECAREQNCGPEYFSLILNWPSRGKETVEIFFEENFIKKDFTDHEIPIIQLFLISDDLSGKIIEDFRRKHPNFNKASSPAKRLRLMEDPSQRV